MRDDIKEVKKLGLETCVMLGLLKEHQAIILKEAGLDFYNHNIDISKEFYDKTIITRTFQDRLDTLHYVRASGMKVCCGGILGMGETNDYRINMILTLANAESVTINKLIKIPGTPLENVHEIDPFDFIRVIALARIMIPKSYIRLSAGREQMSDELQALCIMAGVNSIFYGEKLLTSANPMPKKDNELFERLSIK
ncbi:MAG: biotin synthase BioB [Rickettsia helvetica]|uniref:Biotin synthase BioB n=1 Tax=Rickettsia helvetica TaxID=35789 RepID=A0ABP0T537_RICHE